MDAPSAERALTARTVHIVDDDPNLLAAIKMILELSNFQVRAYSRAADFLVDAETGNGCVVTDYRMPELDGLTLLRTLNERQIRLPAIVMSGAGDDRARAAVIAAGAFAYVDKPFDPDALILLIESALRNAA